MRRYETIVIINPDLTEDDRVSLLSRTQEIIPQQEGVLIQEDLWGIRKLAYEIKKKPRGYYARLDYCGTGKVVDELERFFRIDDRVMKYLTVQTDAEADVEKIQAEVAAAKSSAAEQTTSAGETPETNTASDDEPPTAAKEAGQPAQETPTDETTPDQ